MTAKNTAIRKRSMLLAIVLMASTSWTQAMSTGSEAGSGPASQEHSGDESEIDVVTRDYEDGSSPAIYAANAFGRNRQEETSDDEQGPPTLTLEDVVRLPSARHLYKRLSIAFSDDLAVMAILDSEGMQNWLTKLPKKQRSVVYIAQGLRNTLDAYYASGRRGKKQENYLSDPQQSALIETILADYQGAIKCWQKVLRQSK